MDDDTWFVFNGSGGESFSPGVVREEIAGCDAAVYQRIIRMSSQYYSMSLVSYFLLKA